MLQHHLTNLTNTIIYHSFTELLTATHNFVPHVELEPRLCRAARSMSKVRLLLRVLALCCAHVLSAFSFQLSVDLCLYIYEVSLIKTINHHLSDGQTHHLISRSIRNTVEASFVCSTDNFRPWYVRKVRMLS